MTELINRRAVVCGATQGIGRACAEALARAGAEVCLLARHAEGLESVHAGLDRSHGQTHRFRVADFTRLAEVQAAAEAEATGHGPISVLVHNTGGPPGGPAFEAGADEYEKAFSLHLLSGQVLVQALVPGMAEQRYGRIINIISTSVVLPIRGLGVSNTIRGAVANWARTLAAELGAMGITVNNVLPGYTDTARLRTLIQGRATRAGLGAEEIAEEMKRSIPARRFASADEIANVVAFLASPAASYVNGVNLPVDGGRLASQ
ncbi:MAG: SDR family oxidoreductase [Phycisphaeraceae bacterium]|nr:SDR family oxidoreductase [Phycisphaeraceae bacterium]